MKCSGRMLLNALTQDLIQAPTLSHFKVQMKCNLLSSQILIVCMCCCDSPGTVLFVFFAHDLKLFFKNLHEVVHYAYNLN